MIKNFPLIGVYYVLLVPALLTAAFMLFLMINVGQADKINAVANKIMKI